jgi:hypothetical protein
MTSAALPDDLLSGSHDRAELARYGVTDNELRGPGWHRTNQGLWAWTATPTAPDDPGGRIAHAAPLVPEHGALGGWAAAYMHGFIALDGVSRGGQQAPVLLCLPRAVTCQRRHGVQVFRSDLAEDEIVVIDGVRVTSLVRTAADLARLSRAVTEAVVALDVLIRDADGLVAPAAAWFDAHRGWRGVVRGRQALELARPGTESVQESRLRMMWVLDAGLPMPLVNPWLFTPEGHLLGRADLLDDEAGVIGEYDGAYHASAAQRSSDHTRREGFEGAGLIVVQHTKVDLTDRSPQAIARLRRARADGLARDRGRDRWVIGPAPDWFLRRTGH